MCLCVCVRASENKCERDGVSDLVCACVFAAGSLLLGPWLALSFCSSLPSDCSGRERGIIYGFLGVTATCTLCVCVCALKIAYKMTHSTGAWMKMGKRVNTRILKTSSATYLCQYAHTFSASLSDIEFPAQQLAGRFSVRLSHSQGVRWNTSNCAQLTSYFQYSVCFVFCCCGAWCRFEHVTAASLVVVQLTKVKWDNTRNQGWGAGRILHFDFDLMNKCIVTAPGIFPGQKLPSAFHKWSGKQEKIKLK